MRNLAEATAEFPATPIGDELLGAAMLYSSGTTGRPKGVLRPLPDQPPAEPHPLLAALSKLWRFREGQTYLSPAPLYHAAPLTGVHGTIRLGGTAVIMERFDPEQFLELVEKHRVTHTQLVPTMFSRMLKLPEDTRRAHDLSSLEIAIHAAAPCPAPVKRAMIDWWGPIILEYYGATEGLGFTFCDSAEWLAHPGTIGKAVFGELHVLDEAMCEVPTGQTGKLWFKTASPFEYFNDPAKTAEANSPDRTMSTVGDIGHVEEDGYVYLTDRAAFMIISGGVNIYPQECENLLVTHPKVADAAVFGVPHEEMGEEVKAIVQLMPDFAPGAEMEAELIAFCRDHLAHHKCPRSIDFASRAPAPADGQAVQGPVARTLLAGAPEPHPVMGFIRIKDRAWSGRRWREGGQHVARPAAVETIACVDENQAARDRRPGGVERAAAGGDVVDGRERPRHVVVPENPAIADGVGADMAVDGARQHEVRRRGDSGRLRRAAIRPVGASIRRRRAPEHSAVFGGKREQPPSCRWDRVQPVARRRD